MPITGSPDGAAPLVGEIADRPEVLEPLALELAVELMDEPLDRRTLELESELADGLAEELQDVGRGLLELGHRWMVVGRPSLPPIPYAAANSVRARQNHVPTHNCSERRASRPHPRAVPTQDAADTVQRTGREHAVRFTEAGDAPRRKKESSLNKRLARPFTRRSRSVRHRLGGAGRAAHLQDRPLALGGRFQHPALLQQGARQLRQVRWLDRVRSPRSSSPAASRSPSRTRASTPRTSTAIITCVARTSSVREASDPPLQEHQGDRGQGPEAFRGRG